MSLNCTFSIVAETWNDCRQLTSTHWTTGKWVLFGPQMCKSRSAYIWCHLIYKFSKMRISLFILHVFKCEHRIQIPPLFHLCHKQFRTDWWTYGRAIVGYFLCYFVVICTNRIYRYLLFFVPNKCLIGRTDGRTKKNWNAPPLKVRS